MNPTNISNAIASAIRHALAALAVLGTYLASHNLISAGDVATVNGAGLTLGNALTAVITAVIARGLIWLAAILFGKSSAPGVTPCLLLACVLFLSLASCTAPQLAEYQAITRAVPVTIGGTYNGLSASYNTQTGVTVYYDAAGKPVAQVAAPPAARQISATK